MAPTTPPSPAAIKERNAVLALKDLKAKGRADLAQKFVADFVAAAFTVNSAVVTDIGQIANVSAPDASALQTMVADPKAVALFFFDGTGLQQVGGVIGNTAGGIAQTPGKIGNGVIAGLGSVPGAGTLTDLSGFLSALTQRNTWMRVGEGMLGLILIGIGIFAITRSQPLGKAAINLAGQAAKVVPK